MKRSIDIVIAATEYDSAPSLALQSRLGQLLPSGAVTAIAEDSDGGVDHLGRARVVVLLHGWMWGRSALSRATETVLETRIAKEDAKFLVVVTLDDAPLPTWAARARAIVRGDTANDACLATILEAAKANGASMLDEMAADLSPQLADWEDRNRQREVFFATHRAVAACDREFRKLVEDVVRRAKLLESAEVQSAPGRCVIQLGDVALTVSWIRGRSAAADGRLMIVEWEGQVQRGSRRAPERTSRSTVPRVARVRREHVLLADATREDNWRWRRESFAWASYSPEDLAAACVDSLAASRTEDRM